MRRISRKTAKRILDCSAVRRRLVVEVNRCEMCGTVPRVIGTGRVAWGLHVHEIARGTNRQKSLDKRYACLVLCYGCHMKRIHDGKENWTEAAQLALLKRSRPEDYDLELYNRLVGYGINRITEEDVDQFITMGFIADGGASATENGQ